MVLACFVVLCPHILLLFSTLAPSICDELLFVQALWRHGDRTPVHVFPTDTENGPETWKNGLGELTKVGINDAYRLGQLLRRRYNGLLDHCSFDRQVRFRSTDYNRTLMSAMAVHAGMLNDSSCFVEKGIYKMDVLRRWSPIPVHTTPSKDDYLLDQPCPKGYKLSSLFWNTSQTVASYSQKHKLFFDFVSNATGWTIGLANISKVFDALRIIEKHRPHKLPYWANETVINLTNVLSHVSWTEQYNYIPATRLFKGHLLYHIIDLFAQKIANTSNYAQTVKFEGYSVHDATLVMLLVLLGAYEFKPFSMPSYSSCIAMELWRREKQYFVKLLYRDGINSDIFSELRMSGCPEPPELCTFNQFVNRSKAFLVEHPWNECSDQSFFAVLYEKISDESIQIALLTIVLVSLASCCVIFTGLIAKLWLENKRRYKEYCTVRLDDMVDGFFHRQGNTRDVNIRQENSDSDEEDGA